MKLASFEAIVRALNQANVRYIVVGGLAVIAHGFGRTTFDVDLVLELNSANITEAFAALEAIGYRPTVPINADQFSDAVLRSSWIAEKGMLVMKMWGDSHRETPLDIFVTEPFDFKAEYEAALLHEVGSGAAARVLQLETLLAMKLAAGRPKDLADVDELNLLYGKPSSYDRQG